MVILFLDRKNRDLVRGVGVTAASAVLALSLAVFFGYDNYVKTDGGCDRAANASCVESRRGAQSGRGCLSPALAFEQRIVWVESLGIAYHVGVDGVSAPMVLADRHGSGRRRLDLVGISKTACANSWLSSCSWSPASYGVFIAVDLFMLFFFYELAIFPMYLLIAGWGWVKLREYAAMKLTLYILVGSVFALVGGVAMYFAAADFFSGSGADVFEAAVARRDLARLTADPTVGASSNSRWPRRMALSASTFWALKG